MSENYPTPTPEYWAGGYPPPPPPKRRTGVLVSIAIGSVVVIAAVLVTGLGWPGWARHVELAGAGASPGHPSPATATHSTTPVTNACTLLSAAQVQQVLGTTDELRPEQQGPIHDPVTNTPGYLCTFTGTDGVLADVEVADYPKNIGAQQLVHGAGSTGTDPNPVTGVGDAAETVTNLGNANNEALIAVRADSNAVRLIVVVINGTANPTVSELTQLAKLALNAG